MSAPAFPAQHYGGADAWPPRKRNGGHRHLPSAPDPWAISVECGEGAHELCESRCDCQHHLDVDLLRDLFGFDDPRESR